MYKDSDDDDSVGDSECPRCGTCQFFECDSIQQRSNCDRNTYECMEWKERETVGRKQWEMHKCHLKFEHLVVGLERQMKKSTKILG